MAYKRRSSVHHRSGKTVAFCGFVNIQSPNSPFEVPCTLYFSVVNRLHLKKWRAKGVLRSTTEVAKLLLSVVLSTFRVQILHSKFHAQFISVSSIDCVWRNGVQKTFFGPPQKWQNCCFLSVRQHSESKFSIRDSMRGIHFSVVNRFSWKKWRVKGVLRYTTKVAKLLLFVGSSTFRVQILQSKLHTHFI